MSEQLQASRAAPAEPAGAPAPASPGALAGLTLPETTPPLPDVPGINLQGLPPAPMAPEPTPPAPAVPARPDGPPILLAFQPKSALLSSQAKTALNALALARGSAGIRVAGFGEQNTQAGAVPDQAPDEAALTLALHRARRIADALTAAGVPPQAITLTAVAAGSGGFAQLVY